MNQFVDVLQQIQYGSLNEELSEKLQKLVQACESTQRLGSISLTLKLKPGRGNSGQMEITPIVKVQIPEAERGSAILFVTPEGHLQTQDPRQKNLELQQVEPKKPLKFTEQNKSVAVS